jgi:hypothetical protein
MKDLMIAAIPKIMPGILKEEGNGNRGGSVISQNDDPQDDRENTEDPDVPAPSCDAPYKAMNPEIRAKTPTTITNTKGKMRVL